MWVNKSMREQGGGETGAMLKWAGSERPAVIEGEKQEYKFHTSRYQRHFLSRPAVSLHISFFTSFSAVPKLLQNELQKIQHAADTFFPHLHDPLHTSAACCQHLCWCWWTGRPHFLCLHIFPAVWCPNVLFFLFLQAEQWNGWW